jgi:hypothetical protein
MKFWRVAVEYIDTEDAMVTDDGRHPPRVVSESHSITDEMMQQVVPEIGPEGIIAGVATVCYRNVRQKR